MQHHRLLNNHQSSAKHDQASFSDSKNYGAKGDAADQHVHQIVTTRGEGLADLLNMKREFERHITKFAKLTRRVEEIEKGNSFIRNLDLENMVTPGGLEEKVRQEILFVDTKMENIRTTLMNTIETRCKEVVENATGLIQERVSKKEYQQNKTFMMGEIRGCESKAQQALSLTDNLQTKYVNLDEYYAKKEPFELLR